MKKQIVPILIIFLCLALLLGGAAFFVFLTQYTPAKNSANLVYVSALAVVRLEGSWADDTFVSEITSEQETAMDATLDAVQALGGNAIALTGRFANGDVIWRDSTETLPTYANITKTDHFFAQFDALDYLITAASARGMEVLLIPTAEDGSVLGTDALDALPSFITTLLDSYALRLFTQTAAATSLLEATTDAADAQTTADTEESSAEEPALTAAQTIAAYSDCYQVSTLQEGVCTAATSLYYVVSEPAAVALAFAQSEGEATAFLGDYATLASKTGYTSHDLFTLYYASGAALPDLTDYLGSSYLRSLSVTYPTQDNTTVTDKSLFLMGTSDPDAALTLDGEEIPRYGTEGVWGVLVTLSAGDNIFTLTNGTSTLAYSVYYNAWSGGGSGSSSSETANYYAVAEGQTIQITSDIASALSSVYSSSSITQTFYKGAVAEVTRYLSYAGSTTPYAYQLTTGDWVRASTCALFDTNHATIDEGGITFDDETRASAIYLTGGTPAVYHTWEGNTLTLTLMTASYRGSAPTSDWFSSTVATDGENTIFTFTFTEDAPLYGWAVNYDTDIGSTTLTLKQYPHLSEEDDTLPLTGVRVLLDAGHGLADLGAMGAGGLDAPCEKDVNLALTMATKYRLEQLGATVILTRDDDSFPTLDDRVTALNTLHPDFFISIHHNSLELVSDINNATGVEAYWFYDEGEAFATDLITAVSDAADRNLRSAKYGYYYVTRSNICPATLLEVGFMTNPWEYEQLVDTEILWAEAGAIAQTIYDTVAANG